jgi:DNA-binding transcriptional ArsR family regulator
VLAHPLRSRLLSTLRRDGAATATDLASVLGTNSGATSYHLRKLESVGLVRDTGDGEGKRRLWEASTRFHSFTTSDFADDDDASTAADWLTRHYAHQHVQSYERWLDLASDWPRSWQDAAGASDDTLALTADRALAMHEEVMEVVERYRTEAAAQPDPHAERVLAWFVSCPLDPQAPPALS